MLRYSLQGSCLEASFLFVYSSRVNTLLDSRSVICHLQATEKSQAILEVIDSCSVFSVLPDLDQFKREVLRRERMQSTGIGHGVAVAHGKIKHIHQVRIALGISRHGIDYQSADGYPVHLLFVIASSPSTQLEYLKALSVILRSVRSQQVRDQLINAGGHDSSDESCMRFVSMMASQHFLK